MQHNLNNRIKTMLLALTLCLIFSVSASAQFESAKIKRPIGENGAKPISKEPLEVQQEQTATVSREDGKITGTIRWDKVYGVPIVSAGQTVCDVLTISANIYVKETSATPNRFASQTPVAVGKGRISSEVTETAESYECRYKVMNLPATKQIFVTVVLNSKWQGSNPGGTRAFSPEGWEGNINLNPRIAYKIPRPTSETYGIATDKDFKLVIVPAPR